MEHNAIYKLNENIAFRLCSLFDGEQTAHGNCTSFSIREEKWKRYFSCNQHGIHLHCVKHPALELELIGDSWCRKLRCPKCQTDIEIGDWGDVIQQCLRAFNSELFRDAKLIRLDEWYIPEVKDKIKVESQYWLKTEVKTDKDGDTLVVIYVGHVGNNEKTQFFIKPEKCQLSSDHKDADPKQVLSKIEVTLKDRTLTQIYDT